MVTLEEEERGATRSREDGGGQACFALLLFASLPFMNTNMDTPTQAYDGSRGVERWDFLA